MFQLETVKRRVSLLKMEGMGFSRPEVVNALTEEYGVSERTVYYDFENRAKWQPKLMDIKDTDNILLKILNRYEQIYKHASRIYLTGSDQAVQLGALNTMIKANAKLAETAVIPELIHDLEEIKEKVQRNVNKPYSTRSQIH